LEKSGVGGKLSNSRYGGKTIQKSKKRVIAREQQVWRIEEDPLHRVKILEEVNEVG